MTRMLLQQRIEEYMRKNHMVEAGDHILVGLSGGADSVCLFRVLEQLRGELGFTLEAVHVEHGIRGAESRRDAEFVEELCSRLQVKLSVHHVDVPEYCRKQKLGTEEAARILRYQVFQQVATAHGSSPVKLALAHHMEDNAETILFQMIRGSGLAGLCGMKPVRTEGHMTCIRPMLGVQRAEIEGYLGEIGQKFCTDSTNLELDYSRNRIRQVILPELQRLNDQAIAHMNQTAERLTDIQDYMNSQTNLVCEEVLRERWLEDGTTLVLSLEIEALRKLPTALQQEIARSAIFRCAGKQKDITAVHVQELLRLMGQQSGSELHLPYGIVADREFGEICLRRECGMSSEALFIEITTSFLEGLRENCDKGKTGDSTRRVELGTNGSYMDFTVAKYWHNQEEIPKKPCTKWLDYDMIKNGFSIRNRRAGDFFYTDAEGHRKKLKEYFINEKIPGRLRNEIPLLAQESEIIWIAGGRLSEAFKVEGNTNYILEIHYDGGKR